MTIFRFADNLSLRVGRGGVWIYAPDISALPIHLDARMLRDTGLLIACPHEDRSQELDAPPNHPREDPIRTA